MLAVPTMLLMLIVGALLVAGVLLIASVLGQRPAVASAALRVCRQCGHDNEQRARFCAQCGSRLRGSAL